MNICDVIAFTHQNAKEFDQAMDELIAQAVKDKISMAVIMDLGIILVERLSIELGEIFDKHGFVMEVKDLPLNTHLN